MASSLTTFSSLMPPSKRSGVENRKHENGSEGEKMRERKTLRAVKEITKGREGKGKEAGSLDLTHSLATFLKLKILPVFGQEQESRRADGAILFLTSLRPVTAAATDSASPTFDTVRGTTQCR